MKNFIPHILSFLLNKYNHSFSLLLLFVFINQGLNAQQITIASNPVPVLAANICVNTLDVPVHSFTLTGSGGGGTVTAVSFITAGTYATSDLVNFKLWSTPTNVFTTPTQIGLTLAPVLASGSTMTFGGINFPVANTTYFLWITMDVSSLAFDQRTVIVNSTQTSNIFSSTTIVGSGVASNTQKIITIPLTPSVISGTAAVCPGVTGLTYTVISVPNNTYFWQVPTGWSIISGQGTNSISVQAGSFGQNGNISVRAEKSPCAVSPDRTQGVTVNPPIPATPGSITVPASTTVICPNTAGLVYSISSVTYASATGYVWTVPTGWNITSGQGSTSITVSAGAFGQNGNITVTASNSCGISSQSLVAVQVQPPVPNTPGSITGPTTGVCQGSVQQYSVNAVTNATNYNWTVPGSWTITAGAGTNSITVTIGNSSGSVTVNAENSCGTSATGSSSVTITPLPAIPGSITGPSPACEGTSQTYSVPAVANATTYTWTLPSGWSITGGAGTRTITVLVGTAGGSITVKASNLCGETSSVRTVNVTLNGKITLTSGATSNNQNICVNTSISTISYSLTGGATGANVTGLPAGVNPLFNTGELTLSGTPSVAGTFPYTINTTGTCIQTSASGILTVTANAAINLTSGASTTAQTLCINNAIANIVYNITGGATNASVTGLPAGVSESFSAGVLRISGTPTVSGTFNYMVTTSGTCLQFTASGSIIVNPNASISLTSGTGSNIQNPCVNSSINNITYSIVGATSVNITGLPFGVTGSYTSSTGEYTISGMPTTSGTFNYTISTVGTCIQTSATGTITVSPNASISLTSGTGTNSQTRCINTSISTITYLISGGATGAIITGLPTNVSSSISGNTITISGTAMVAGSFDYLVSTTGTCVQSTVKGTLIINQNAAINLTSASGTDAQSVCRNSPIQNITYFLSGGATGAIVSGLPAGVTNNFIAGVVTISGSPSISGNFSYTVATIGNCIQTNATGIIGVNTQPPVGTPSPIAGNPPTCQLTNGSTTTNFTTTAANSLKYNWSISNPAAGSIDSATGVMTWAFDFSGSVDIRVTASGCSGTSPQVSRTVSITPTVGIPTAIIISTGIEPNCQLTNSSTVTIYSSSATNSTGLVWAISNFAAGTINPSTGAMTWNNGFSGTVDIQVIANGCNGPSVREIRTVNITPANFRITNSPLIQTICSGGSSTLVPLTSNVANTIYSWTASSLPRVSGYTTSGTDTIPVQTIISTGNAIDTVTYTITPTANGCRGPIIKYVITILPKPIATITVTPVRTCAPATINFTNTSKFANTWEWYLNGTLFSSDSIPPTLNISTPNNYVFTLVAINSLGCGIDSMSKTVVVSNTTRPAMEYPRINAVKGLAVQLNAMGGGIAYAWSPSTGLDNPNIKNPTFLLNSNVDSIIYSVKIIDTTGCPITDRQVVWMFNKPGVHMPTAFTPNGDGINDLFIPVFSSNIRVKYLRIFDRWGKLIFETIDMTRGWDGTINGIPSPMSTYVWVISAIDTYGNDIVKKGSVTLIRN